MMLSKVEARKKVGADAGHGKLLREIETISKALYLDKKPSRPLIGAPSNRSKSAGKTQLVDTKSRIKYGSEDPSHKDKKSIWNWKPLKAFSNVRNRKFNCCFTLYVHSVEGLPLMFENVSLRVHWKRRDGELVTRPVKVLEGIAEFEERLIHTCPVYGSRSGPHHSTKYEAKHFLLYASVFGAQELDLGKHRVDLTRLLPLTLEELEEEKSSGKWTTCYKLSGEAKGAVMNVSFGYMVVGDGPVSPRHSQNVPELLNLKQNNARAGKTVPKLGQGGDKSAVGHSVSLSQIFNQHHLASSRSVEDVKDLHEVLPISRSEPDIPANMLPHKFVEHKLDVSLDYTPEVNLFTEHHEPTKPHAYPVAESSQKSIENGLEDCEVSVIENPLSESSQKSIENGLEECEFSVIEKGVELSQEKVEKPEEVNVKAIDVSTAEVKVDSVSLLDFENGGGILSGDNGNGSFKDEPEVRDWNFKEDEVYSKESVMNELECALNNVSSLESDALDSPEEKENFMEVKTGYETNRKGRSLSLDHLTESVANEFLEMLGIEHSPFSLSSESEPESPREQLLRQFEKDAQANGCSLFDFDMVNEDQSKCGYSASLLSGQGNFSDGFELPSTFENAKEEHQMGTQGVSGQMKAKMLEDLETEALMLKWGLDDEAFQFSPPKGSGCFGSPIDLPPEEPFALPTLGEGLGPFMQTNDGGFLRTMNPSLFKGAKTGGSLIMQVSSPVVVPAEMGSGIMDILQQLASVGIEKLSMQANKLMPLEDITGKTMQQVAWEAAGTLEAPERQDLLQHELEIGHDVLGGNLKGRSSSTHRSNNFASNSAGVEMGSEYVSLEDLAPLAMGKIEALSVEGLRIQSGMSDVDAPANIRAQSLGEFSALQGKGVDVTGSLGLEGTAGLQLLDIKDASDDIDGLMGLSLTLDEWMRLDSGDIGDEDQISERTSKILAAHHASTLDFIHGGSKAGRRRGKGSGRKCGLLGNNFTVALMVQLRDPLRNYEPVGTPMLALIQVERVFVPPKPKIYCKVSEVRNNNEEDDETESVVKEEAKEAKEEKTSEEEGIPQFRITEVHVAGLKTEPGKKKLWGSTTQQQSGSRWLLANGMGKTNKHPIMRSKPVSAKSTAPMTTKVQPGDTLWSISSRIHGTGAKWKELAALNPHIRNPNVILPNETIRLK